MSRLEDTISTIVRTFAERRRIRVGLIYRGNRPVAEHIVLCGQKTLVLGERFHPLYRLLRGFQTNGGDVLDRVLMVETRLGALPVAPRSLDVLVLSAGLPDTSRAREALVALRGLLTPGGLLVWAHPDGDGALHRFFSGLTVGTRRRNHAIRRADICRIAMSAGFCEVGQVAVSQPLGSWVITTGRRGRRPWETSETAAPAIQ